MSHDIKIDWDFVNELLEANVSGFEIASRIGIKHQELYGACERDHQIPFKVYRSRMVDRGNDLLKRKIFDMAMSGNERILLQQAKVRLKQHDRPTVNIPGFSEMSYPDKIAAVMRLVEQDEISTGELAQMLGALKMAYELENGQVSLERLEELEKKLSVKE